MKFNRKNSRYFFMGMLFWGLCSSFSLADKEPSDDNLLEKKVKLSNRKGNTYQLFRYLSEQYDCMFIYDSRVIENNHEADIKQGRYALRDAICRITKNEQLILENIGQYISIRLPQNKEHASSEENQKTREAYFQIKGNLRDKKTNKPITYATVNVMNSPINTVTNQEGNFTITLRDSLNCSMIRFSHIGYRSLEIAAADLVGQSTILTLEQDIINLPEVHVRAVNTELVMQEYFKNRSKNYSKTPVYMDIFYREGIEQEKGSKELIEAVFKMYKDRYDFDENQDSPLDLTSTDMVKLEKMRTMVFETEHKFVNFQIKSGIQSLIQLDIVKSTQDFLAPRYADRYHYAYEGATSVDEQRLYIISFQPKPDAKESLYQGRLYVDEKSKALVMARFEVYPAQIKEVEKMLVVKNGKSIGLSLKKAVYTVLYKELDGVYYLNYMRIDLVLNARKRMSFSGRNISGWIEMVCTDMNMTDVKRFGRSERFPTHTIFSKTRREYDFSFWNTYRIITPEERFLKLIRNSESVENASE